MPVYYPSIVAEFTLMFDEALHLIPDLQPAGISDALSDLDATLGLSGLEGETPLVLKRGPDNGSFIAARVPKSASVVLGGYRQASTFTLVFDFVDLPIDPRTIRQAAISIFIGTVSAKSFSDGMISPQKVRQSVLQTRLDNGDINEDNRALVGTVDTWEVTHGEESSEVTITGRDLRGLLLDVPIDIDPGASKFILDTLELDKPIHDVVDQILRFTKLFKDITVDQDTTEWLGKVPSPGEDTQKPRIRKGAKGDKKGGRATQPGSAKMSFWDLIVQYCFLVGAVPYFYGQTLRIRPVYGLYRQVASDGKFDPTPFANGEPRSLLAGTKDAIPDGPISVRRMVYGRDLLKLTMNRNLGGSQRPRTVRVVSNDSSSPERGLSRNKEAIWPPKKETKAKVTKPLPNSKDAVEEVINIPVAGISDTKRLEEIARAIYEEIGRGELGGVCETKNLSSFGGDNADPDLLHLRPGDAVEFVFDRHGPKTFLPAASTITEMNSMSFESLVNQLELNGCDTNLARVIAATARNQVQELQRYFRCSKVSFSFSAEEGASVSFEFQNFVEVRAAVGEQVASPAGDNLKKFRPDYSFTLDEVEGR